MPTKFWSITGALTYPESGFIVVIESELALSSPSNNALYSGMGSLLVAALSLNRLSIDWAKWGWLFLASTASNTLSTTLSSLAWATLKQSAQLSGLSSRK